MNLKGKVMYKLKRYVKESLEKFIFKHKHNNILFNNITIFSLGLQYNCVQHKKNML